MVETKKSKKWFAIGTGVLGLILAVALVGSAQTSTGTITGAVTDPQALAMVSVNVEVLDTDTGAKAEYPTNASGLYVATLLEPGNYEVTASKSGFQTVIEKGIVLHVGETLTVDIRMPLQSAQGSVTVTEQAPLLETEKTAQSQTVSQSLVEGLPMVGRRWEDFVLLTPGVTTDGTSGLSSFHGISGLYNGNSVDGANNTQAFFSEARGRAIIVAYVYSPDSIKEFEVSASNYSAEYGQAAGGVVNAVTRSGSNELHGDLFYNLRYPSLNALDPVTKNSGVHTQSVHQQQQYGGSFGAPILKNKLFFFGTYDGFRKVNPIVYTSTTPASELSCPTGFATAAQCAAGLVFFSGTLDGAFPRDLKQNVFLGKLDYQLNAANHLSAVFNLQDWAEPYGYNTSATVNNGGSTNNGYGSTHERFLIATWESTISTSMLNEARFQWGRDYEYDGTNGGGPFVSLTNIASYGETSALPRPAFPDEHRYQISDNLSILKGEHSFKFGVDVNFIHELLVNLFQGDGSYSYSNPALPASAGCTATNGASAAAEDTFCGWLADVYNINLGDTYSGLTGNSNTGTHTFCTPTIPIPNPVTSATCFSLTGRHYSSFTQVEDPITHVGADDFYDDDYGAYFEDSWKVRHNVTVTLGLRYDLQRVPPPPTPNTGTPLLTLYTSTLNLDKNNIAPRIGVAWQLDSKTVVRAGYGIFYGKTSNSTYYALRVENGVYQQTFTGCTVTNANPTLQACAPTFPNVYFVPPGPTLAAAFSGSITPTALCTVAATTPPAIPPPPSCPSLSGGSLPTAAQAVHGMTPDFVNPVAHEGELTIERQIPGHMTVSASYLLTRGIHLPSDYDANVAPANGATKTYDVLASAVNNAPTAFTATVPFYTQRLNPSTGIILNQASVVNSWYNALILTLRKPMSHGLELLLNYTYSKALDDGQTAGSNGTFFGTDDVLDPYHVQGDYSYSDLDQRHRFVGSVVWQPMYAQNMSSEFAKQLLDGWDVSGILTAATGQPYSAYLGTSVFGGGIDGGLTGGEVSTFASAVGGRVSWLPRNSYNLPNFANIDLRFGRGFTIHEKYRLDFRVEAYNLFNSVIVTGVNTTAYTESAAGSGACGGHTNICMVPSSTFGSRTTTSGILYGARQMQFGTRFEF